jgi:hypothetical protein
LVEGTVDAARRHALQVIHLEQSLHIFVERPIQEWFIARPTVMHWINRVYSFIHIPGTILFLIMLYYFTTTQKRSARATWTGSVIGSGWADAGAGPALYEARRRAMAMCNLMAFVVFTLWPCMPPRLLSDPGYDGDDAKEANGFGFVDTVHSSTGESSIWTTNKFCNQYGKRYSAYSMMYSQEANFTHCSRDAVAAFWLLPSYRADHGYDPDCRSATDVVEATAHRCPRSVVSHPHPYRHRSDGESLHS